MVLGVGALRFKWLPEHFFLFSVSFIFYSQIKTIGGEGNGTPLQYSCLENPVDGGAWQAAVHGVAKSDTTEWLHFHFHALEKEMATHSSVLAWRIPGTGEPGGLPSMGSHRVGHDWSDLAVAKTIGTYHWLNVTLSLRMQVCSYNFNSDFLKTSRLWAACFVRASPTYAVKHIFVSQ